ncbi:hypothetical protein HMPREF0653_01590 [Prevotella disiens JCM 6334 = ATCC 29426]|uniref:Uncharacterized protein n=1 Tax=Prevotella disiens JCM 6334 = ATCC 29426 TaxID=1235811 RepID=A0ABP2Y6U4_9BACT|nr:hypothetical protein HMPREF0653_01590 [Prevotella disiens JCM 6334 = ATCC 29426]
MLIFSTCLWILEQRLIAMILKVSILPFKTIGFNAQNRLFSVVK